MSIIIDTKNTEAKNMYDYLRCIPVNGILLGERPISNNSFTCGLDGSDFKISIIYPLDKTGAVIGLKLDDKFIYINSLGYSDFRDLPTRDSVINELQRLVKLSRGGCLLAAYESL